MTRFRSSIRLNCDFDVRALRQPRQVSVLTLEIVLHPNLRERSIRAGYKDLSDFRCTFAGRDNFLDRADDFNRGRATVVRVRHLLIPDCEHTGRIPNRNIPLVLFYE
jgi:hypothetical protein